MILTAVCVTISIYHIVTIDGGKLVVRSSYSDRFYAELAREAIRSWKNQDEWGDTYHE